VVVIGRDRRLGQLLIGRAQLLMRLRLRAAVAQQFSI
jgi:hypothetical protein